MSLSDLRRELSDQALKGLPADLRRQADEVMEAYISTEIAIRRVADRFLELNDGRAIIEPSELSQLTLALRGVKTQQDIANAALESMIGACNAQSVDDNTAASLRGILSAFVEGVGQADRVMQETIAAAAARHGIHPRR